MNTKITQCEIVLTQMRKNNFISNFWAQKNYILRLASRINDLRRQGHDIIGLTGKQLRKPKKYHKNYYYYFRSPLNPRNK